MKWKGLKGWICWLGIREIAGLKHKLLVDYVIVDERLRSWVQNARVYRGTGARFDLYLAYTKVKMRVRWVNERKVADRNEEEVDW